jgi:hypothetical protein
MQHVLASNDKKITKTKSCCVLQRKKVYENSELRHYQQRKQDARNNDFRGAKKKGFVPCHTQFKTRDVERQEASMDSPPRRRCTHLPRHTSSDAFSFSSESTIRIGHLGTRLESAQTSATLSDRKQSRVEISLLSISRILPTLLRRSACRTRRSILAARRLRLETELRLERHDPLVLE